MTEQPLDLTMRPTSLTTDATNTIATLRAIKAQGGYTVGMARTSGKGLWSLRIDWPQPTLFAPAVRQSVQGVPIPIQ
jgi:hypothetical protein